MKQKQTIDINGIMREFDQYIKSSLNSNIADQEPQAPSSQLEQYYQNMEKRLKLKTVTQQQKFQNLLGPMKKLKSFVNINEFLKGMNRKPAKQSSGCDEMSQKIKNKLQYENARGGLCMQRVESHLRRNNLKRKLDDQAQCLLRELQQNQPQKNQYRTWMEGVLDNINMKQQKFLCPKQYEAVEKPTNNLILTGLTHNDSFRSNRKQNCRRRIDQEKQLKNFKKVSDFLAYRLKKVLNDKFVNNSSKQLKKNKDMMIHEDYEQSYRTVTQPPNITKTSRKTLCQTSATSKRVRQSVKNVNFRTQTAQIRNRKPSEDVWKRKLNIKMDGVLSVADNCYKKAIQQKKQYKNIINPFCVLIQDDYDNR